jgi:hypothetical protein
MPAGWKLYRIICILQMTSAGYILMSSLLTSFSTINFSLIIRLLVFLMVILLAIFAVTTLNNNYPDKPVDGSQKRTFNRLFLVNFIFLALLFGFVISEFRFVNQLATITRKNIWQLSFRYWSTLVVYIVTILFQLVILYGLYNLRQLLYLNFRKQKFEFEQ